MTEIAQSKAVNLAVLGFLVTLILLLGGAPLFAQFTTASLSGAVTDRAALAIPDAVVTIKNVESAFTQTTKTGPEGEYRFPNLPVGNYEMTVTRTGFTTYIQNGITLSVNQSASQNVQLQVGSLVQEITVESGASLVTTDSPSVGQLINQKNIVDLPLNGREVQQLVFLAPGATNVTAHYCGAACEGGVFPGEQYAKINGSGSNGVNYQLDGVDYNDTYINSNLPFPNPDALQEFNVQTSNMSAAYGNAIGGVVNVVTKSGSNKIHGDVFEFLRNGAFNARNYFADSADPLKRNQFGGSVGGPIKKDKLFFFGTYQSTILHTATNGQIAFVPTAAERTGDFSDLLPATQLVDPVTGAPYLNNQIPTSAFSPVSQYLLQHIPLPNGPGRQLTFSGLPSIQDDSQFLVKLDYNAGKHHLSGRYFYLHYNNPVFLPTANLLQARGGGTHITMQTIGINDIYTATSNLVLNSFFGYTAQDGDSLSSSPFSMAQAGVNIATTSNTGTGAVPEISLSVIGGFNIHTSHFGIWNRSSQTYREVATLLKGAHTLQFGGEALRIRLPISNPYEQNGVFGFSNNLSGDNIADFMLGRLSNFTQSGGLYLNFTGIKWSAFVQDDWKATSRLTLSAGLRWDPFFPYTDSFGRVGCFVPGAQSVRYPNAPTGLLFGGSNHDAGCPASSIFSTPWNFAPRLGFAYRATNDGKTSVRGGIGYYYQPPNTVMFEDVVGIPPFAPVIGLTDVSLSDPYGSAGVQNPFPAQFGPINPGPNATFPQDISFTQIFDRHYHLPQVVAWNLTAERELASGWLARAAYVGNRGTYLSGSSDQEAGLLALNPAIYIPGQSTEANTQQRRIYPSFGYINSINSGVNSNYHSLQFTLEKHLSHGFSFMTNYTWSKILDDFAPIPPGGGSASGTNTCTCGRYFDYGPSDDNITHVLKLTGSYNLPHTRFNGLAGKITNGWQITSVSTWQGGTPFTIFSGLDNSFSGIGQDRANLVAPKVGNAVLSTSRSHSQMVNQYFNTSGFGPNPIGTFGNTGKNILTGPRYFDSDLALLQSTKLTETTSLQFRAEFFNAFNNVNFGNPDNALTDSAFGQITSASDPRILQFAMKFLF
jgi:hypothetical protein